MSERQLPLDARARLAALEETCPEAAAIMRRLYPSDAKDRAAREVAEAERTARAKQAEANRIELCKRAQAGDFGDDAKAAAALVLQETGGELTSIAVIRITKAVQKAQFDQRFAKPTETSRGNRSPRTAGR